MKKKHSFYNKRFVAYMHKIHLRPRLRPRSQRETHDALPNPPSQLRGDTHSYYRKMTEPIGSASDYGLEYAENAFAAGASPRTPLGELTKIRRL